MSLCNIAATKHCVTLAMRCGCAAPVVEWLDSSAVGIAQLAHPAGESIFCREGGDLALSKLHPYFLL